jgi:hypothetical protein
LLYDLLQTPPRFSTLLFPDQQIFNGPLPHLRALHVDSSHRWQKHHSCMTSEDLGYLVQCCPSLRQLELGAAVAEGADVSPLEQLQQLTALSMCTPLSLKVAARLAVLTHLKSLAVLTETLKDQVLVLLAKLPRLDSLYICHPTTEGPYFSGMSTELMRQHPQQLLLSTHLVSSLCSAAALPCSVHA